MKKTIVKYYNRLIWSGPLDAYFDYQLEILGYRTLEFEPFYGEEDIQGKALILTRLLWCYWVSNIQKLL